MRAKLPLQRLLSGVPAAIAIVAAGLVLGTIANMVSPRGIGWIEDWSRFVEARAYREGIRVINTPEAQQLWKAGTCFFLDARSEKDFATGHIPGAIPLPHVSMSEHLAAWQGLFAPERMLIAYCSGGDCDESLLLAVELKRLGFTNVVLYAGGMQKWREAGYPVDGGS